MMEGHFRIEPRKPTHNFRDPKEVYQTADERLQKAHDMTADELDKDAGFREPTIDKEKYIASQEQFLAEMRVDATYEAHDTVATHKFLIEMAKRANDELRDFEKNEMSMHKDQA